MCRRRDAMFRTTVEGMVGEQTFRDAGRSRSRGQESVGLLTDLISRGAKKLADLSHPPSAVANMVM